MEAASRVRIRVPCRVARVRLNLVETMPIKRVISVVFTGGMRAKAHVWGRVAPVCKSLSATAAHKWITDGDRGPGFVASIYSPTRQLGSGQADHRRHRSKEHDETNP